MSTSKIMQKLKKEHKKQVKKLKPGVRNATPKKTPVPVNKKTPTNLNRAVAKMKATQAKPNANKNTKKVKMINKK